MDQNTNKLIEKLFDQFTNRFDPHIKVMTQLNLANEFYSKEERGLLYIQYQSLLDLSHDAYVDMMKHTEQADVEYKSTDMYRGEHEHLKTKKVEADKLLIDFQKKHRLIVHLFNAKTTFAKFSYEE